MKQIFYDLETTGVKPYRNGIHQLAGFVVIDGEVKEEFNFHVQPNPKCTIEPEALKVAGVTLEQVLAYPPMKDVHTQFVNMLGKYVNKYDKNDKFFLCGYNNCSFDDKFLRGFFLQNGDNYFGSWFWSSSLDVMVLAAHRLASERHLMPNFKLSTVAEYLGIQISDEKLHDALYDIYLTKAIYDSITK